MITTIKNFGLQLSELFAANSKTMNHICVVLYYDTLDFKTQSGNSCKRYDSDDNGSNKYGHASKYLRSIPNLEFDSERGLYNYTNGFVREMSIKWNNQCELLNNERSNMIRGKILQKKNSPLSSLQLSPSNDAKQIKSIKTNPRQIDKQMSQDMKNGIEQKAEQVVKQPLTEMQWIESSKLRTVDELFTENTNKTVKVKTFVLS
ncbi:hypothetical protein GJ496_010174 [Pomphorhynchus laevis]|nr:hypothetical protein GJ496_010174 [Pomphorhynchus laevis]